jgi:hypothetical protein
MPVEVAAPTGPETTPKEPLIPFDPSGTVQIDKPGSALPTRSKSNGMSARFSSGTAPGQSIRSAAHGHKWWEFDMTWWVIRTLEITGLAKDVVRPVKEPSSREQ